MDTQLTLPECIKIARMRAGLDQDRLAAAVHVSRQLVSKWERGKSVPDLAQTVRLARATGVDVSWFAAGVDIDLTRTDDLRRDGSGCTRSGDFQPSLFDPAADEVIDLRDDAADRSFDPAAWCRTVDSFALAS